jgi:hypothetical protein
VALAYSIVDRGTAGDLAFRIVDITLDAAYVSPGGYVLSAQSLGFGSNGIIYGVIPMSNPGFIMDYNPATKSLRVRDASGGVGAATPEAAANLAALNGLVVRCFVLGKGHG